MIVRAVALFTLEAALVFGQEPAKVVTFTDNFTPAASELWNSYSGNWSASAGQYSAQVPNDAPLTFTGLPFVLTDYTLTVTTVIGDGGIWVRANENDPTADYILLVLGGNDYGQGARGGDAGNSIYFATAAKSGSKEVHGVFTPGGTYTITVTARGDTYSAYINGSKTPVLTYVSSAFPSGQVGLYDDQPNTVSGSGFGPATTFSNFSVTGSALPPQINFFAPAGGKAGSSVTITGTNLQMASAVTFNGTSAKFTQEYPSTKIVAIVPAGAGTGPIEVMTPIGTAGVFTVLP